MFVIYSIDYSDYKLRVYNVVSTKEDANRELHDTMINFMEEEEGKKKAKIHRANVSENFNDLVPEITEGYFLNKSENSENVILYHRVRKASTGYIFDSVETETSKVRFFGISMKDTAIETEPSSIINVKPVVYQSKVSNEALSNYEKMLKEFREKIQKKKSYESDED